MNDNYSHQDINSAFSSQTSSKQSNQSQLMAEKEVEVLFDKQVIRQVSPINSPTHEDLVKLWNVIQRIQEQQAETAIEMQKKNSQIQLLSNDLLKHIAFIDNEMLLSSAKQTKKDVIDQTVIQTNNQNDDFKLKESNEFLSLYQKELNQIKADTQKQFQIDIGNTREQIYEYLNNKISKQANEVQEIIQQLMGQQQQKIVDSIDSQIESQVSKQMNEIFKKKMPSIREETQQIITQRLVDIGLQVKGVDSNGKKTDKCIARLVNLEDEMQIQWKKQFELNENFKTRVNKEEYFDLADNLQNEIKLININIKQLVDKEDVKIISERVTIAEKKVFMCMLKPDVEKIMNTYITSMKEFISSNSNIIQDKMNIIEARFDFFQNSFTDINAFIQQARENKDEIIEQIQNKINLIVISLRDKLDSRIFSEFQDANKQFVKKDQLLAIKDNLLQTFSTLESQQIKINESILTFKNFLRSTDEAILFKATRMDLEILKQEIQSKFTPLLLHAQDLSTTQKNISDSKKESSDEFNLLLKSSQENNKATIIEEVATTIKEQILLQFEKLDLQKIDSRFNSLVQSLSRKADLTEVKEIGEQKTLNQEKLSKFVSLMQKQFKQMNYSCLQFMRTFLPSGEFESANCKQHELALAVSRMEQLFQKLSSMNFQLYFRYHDLSQSFDSSLNQTGMHFTQYSRNNSPKRSTRAFLNCVNINIPQSEQRFSTQYERLTPQLNKFPEEQYNSRLNTPQIQPKRLSSNKYRRSIIKSTKPNQKVSDSLFINEDLSPALTKVLSSKRNSDACIKKVITQHIFTDQLESKKYTNQ